MNSLVLRIVCGLLFAALVLGAIAHPPANLTQGLGMLLPAAMLLSVTLRGPRRSLLPRKRTSPPPAAVEGEPR